MVKVKVKSKNPVGRPKGSGKNPQKVKSKNPVGRKPGDGPGKFKKGQASANPGGRPKPDHTLRDAIRSKSPEILKILMKYANGDDPEYAFKALYFMGDRGWGKVPLPVEAPDGQSPGGNVIIHFSKADGEL